MALIQCELSEDHPLELETEEANQLFRKAAETTRDLMLRKNHDYGEAMARYEGEFTYRFNPYETIEGKAD